MFYDVPKDWSAADLHHCFWAPIRFLGEPCPHSTRQYRHFHSAHPECDLVSKDPVKIKIVAKGL
jgi:hypothetical protein